MGTPATMQRQAPLLPKGFGAKAPGPSSTSSSPDSPPSAPSATPLPRLGYYRYLDGRTVVHGLHPALVGHVATRWLPESVRLSKQQMNACAPSFTHGNAPRTKPKWQ